MKYQIPTFDEANVHYPTMTRKTYDSIVRQMKADHEITQTTAWMNSRHEIRSHEEAENARKFKEFSIGKKCLVVSKHVGVGAFAVSAMAVLIVAVGALLAIGWGMVFGDS